MKTIVGWIQDNAMLYKDTTQWLRNKTFIALFFGLLILSESISLIVTLISSDVESPGIGAFISLMSVLVFYTVVIAFMGHSLTNREFVNKTFELYELSGMSLERMVLGKFASMLGQFLFGFFCVVPFMFFAFFLGGLDFLEIFAGLILLLLMVPPLFLLSLVTALGNRMKQVATLARFGIGFLVMIFLFSIISLVAGPAARSGLGVLSTFLKGLLTFSLDQWLVTFFFLVFYVQGCLFLFYLACQMLSRETDSREIQVKLLMTTLCLSWIFTCGLVPLWFARSGTVTMEYAVALRPIYIVLCVMGAMFYYNRPEVPTLIRNKYANRKGFSKGLYHLFQPGMSGAFRSLVLMIFLCLAACVVMDRFLQAFTGYVPSPGSGVGMGLSRYGLSLQRYSEISSLVQIPWFLAFPYMLLAMAPKFQGNPQGMRSTVAAWWGISGFMAMFLVGWASENSGWLNWWQFVAIVVSPFSSAFSLDVGRYGILEPGPHVRVVLGAAGIYLCIRGMRRRRKDFLLEKQEALALIAQAEPAPLQKENISLISNVVSPATSLPDESQTASQAESDPGTAAR